MATATKHRPNSEQLEAYLLKVAELDADDWASLALVLKDSTLSRHAAAKAIEAAHSRAEQRGIQSEVDAATREARPSMDSVLDANTGLQEAVAPALVRIGPDDPSLRTVEWDTAVAVVRAAAISGATLLVLRPLLRDDEFTRAWPMCIVDPRSLPHHVYVPPIGAAG